MLKLKKNYKGQILSNGMVKKFNTNDIDQAIIPYLVGRGFTHLFEEVCDTCEAKRCKCKKPKVTKKD